MLCSLGLWGYSHLCFITINAASTVVGQPFLEMKGRTVAKEKVVLPHYFNKRITLVAFGFSRDVQEQYMACIKPFAQRYANDTAVFFIEIPMLGRAWRFSAVFIESGMRSGIPERLHPHVLPFYGGLSAYKAFYDFPSDKKTAYFVLVDTEGIIQWTHEGLVSDAALSSLFKQVDALKVDD